MSYLSSSAVCELFYWQQQQHHNFEQLEVVSPGLIRAPAASIEKLPFSWASFVPLLRAILLLSLWFLGFTHIGEIVKTFHNRLVLCSDQDQPTVCLIIDENPFSLVDSHSFYHFILLDHTCVETNL